MTSANMGYVSLALYAMVCHFAQNAGNLFTFSL